MADARQRLCSLSTHVCPKKLEKTLVNGIGDVLDLGVRFIAESRLFAFAELFILD